MTAVEERRLKGLLKSAVTEVLAERQDLLCDAIRESLEDMAMLRAIQSGEKSPDSQPKENLPASGSRHVRICFRESFDKDLAKVSDAALLERIRRMIEQVEAARTFQDISNLKRLDVCALPSSPRDLSLFSVISGYFNSTQ